MQILICSFHQGEAAEKYVKEKVPKFLDMLEPLVEGKGGYAVGSSVSVSQLYFFKSLDSP